ncbi:MAG: 5-dehydro-2-deoxygluconokinase [Pseudomonadales bacterium]
MSILSNTVFDRDRPIDVICMGRVAVDLYAEQIGSTLADAQTFRKYLGGCAGNIAVGSARLGLRSAMLSCIGQDEMGVFVKQTLQNEGVGTDFLRVTPEHLTGLVILGIDPPEHFPLMFYRQNCADMQLQPSDCTEQFFQQSKALLVTGTGFSTSEMRATSHHSLDLAKTTHTAVILDIDYRPVLWGLTPLGDGESRYQLAEEVSHHYQQILPKCDLIVGTEEEILIAGGANTLSEALVNIRCLVSAPVVVKTGFKGCQIYLDGNSEPLNTESFPVKVLNVLGAGDGFMSGFLLSWLGNASWQTCMQTANACGAIVVSRHACAPAMPNKEELDYFLQHFASQQDLLQGPDIARRHRRSSVGSAADRELFVLAFDHREQFQQSCENAGKNQAVIAVFKQQIFSGFQLALQQLSQKQDSKSSQFKGKSPQPRGQCDLAILIDPDYGADILASHIEKGVTVGVPIEQPLSLPVSWLGDKPLYQEILQRPAPWVVKVLWQYHPNLHEEIRRQQLLRLKDLAMVCDHLDRRLMVELIIPNEFADHRSATSEAMSKVYEQSIYPFWWKIAGDIAAAYWSTLADILEHNDPHSRIILLGGPQKEIASFGPLFSRAKASGKVSGFAIGRSIFWQPWQRFLTDEIELEEIPNVIAKDFLQCIRLWQEA